MNISTIAHKLLMFVLMLTLMASDMRVYAEGVMVLPPPGTRLALSPVFAPPLLTGIKVFRNDPFRFDFILDKGEAKATDTQVKAESTRLIKYFLAALTVPEKDLWVNLSPYEKDRIVPEAFGRTEMGRDLLAQDYILKQITASIIFPDDKTGKKFWDKVYTEALKRYGTTDVPVDTFNKVWIIPEKATVYENKEAAFVVESKLKVMLETDYLAMERADIKSAATKQGADVMGIGGGLVTSRNGIAQDVLREVVIPILEQEVNEGKSFAVLRQIYNALILATWYKRKIRASIIKQGYVDKQKTVGVGIMNKNEKEDIWLQYVASLRMGAFSFVREELDTITHETVPRKYFSGGTVLNVSRIFKIDSSMLPTIDNAVSIQAAFRMVGAADNILSDGTRFDEEQVKKVVDYLMSRDVHEVNELVTFGQQMGFAKDLFFELIRHLSNQERFNSNSKYNRNKWTSFIPTFFFNGEPTGKVENYWVDRRGDEWRKVGALYVFTTTGKILLQIRNDGTLNQSAGGVVDLGLNGLETSLKECKEEIHLSLDPSNLHVLHAPLGIFHFDFNGLYKGESFDSQGIYHAPTTKASVAEIFEVYYTQLSAEVELRWRQKVSHVLMSWDDYLSGKRVELNKEVFGIVEVEPRVLIDYYLSLSASEKRRIFYRGINGMLAYQNVRDMVLTERHAEGIQTAPGISSYNGGIDLVSPKIDVVLKDNSDAIKLNMDSAVLQRMQNALGVIPIIVSIKPVVSLQGFFSVQD